MPIGIAAQQTGLCVRICIGIPGCEKGLIIYVFIYLFKKKKKERKKEMNTSLFVFDFFFTAFVKKKKLFVIIFPSSVLCYSLSLFFLSFYSVILLIVVHQV